MAEKNFSKTGEQSTVTKGNKFRDAVADLLRTKYQDVATEVRIAHKNVDIVFSYRNYGKTIKVGVECKEYSKPLTKDMIRTEIWSDYGPLVPSDIQEVIIVARHPLNSAAQQYVDTIPQLRFQTYEHLEEDLLGLHLYIKKLASEFKAQEIENYYIAARFDGHALSAQKVIRNWIENPTGDSLAVLGGYGKGKTSLALQTISEQANRHLADPGERIPILLRLGQEVHETSLEGLFGKEFTARQHTEGYRFETLMHLNRAGRLLIVLDGFDEMKHAMSSTDFYNNFREFNRLRGPNAKVLLLGRPNALPSEARTLVFRGQRMVGAQIHNDPAFPPWSEEQIAFFDSTEVDKFLRSYLQYRVANSSLALEDFVNSRVTEIKDQIAFELLRRPVQARIVADLAADPAFDLRGFTAYTLYEQFIRQLVERDSEKRVRKLISTEDRLTFQRELTWWMWTRRESQGHFNRHDVPTDLLQGLPNGGATNLDTKLNEYIVSTLTEEKETGILYFAHRSFLEFLVAERLRKVKISAEQHVVLSKTLTSDITNFLQEAPGQADVMLDWFETLVACAGPLSFGYVRYYQSNSTISDRALANENYATISPAETLIIGMIDARDTLLTSAELSERFTKLGKIVAMGGEVSAAVAAFCLAEVATSLHEKDDKDVIRNAYEWLITASFVRLLTHCSQLREGDNSILIEQKRFGPIEKLIQRSFKKYRDIGTGVDIEIDIIAAFSSLSVYLTSESKFLDDEFLRTTLENDAEKSLLFRNNSFRPIRIPAKAIAGRLKNPLRREIFESVLLPMKTLSFPIVAKSERHAKITTAIDDL
ncbi:NACHT domain-containing protein [Noviherbaspirillum sp. 1P10PC]|uniref:NACHT domain-containing protein n=1 Tax=Noviherbaspirillum sp. 1P10PC TaxID=3132292 RepID=UPI0039A07B57